MKVKIIHLCKPAKGICPLSDSNFITDFSSRSQLWYVLLGWFLNWCCLVFEFDPYSQYENMQTSSWTCTRIASFTRFLPLLSFSYTYTHTHAGRQPWEEGMRGMLQTPGWCSDSSQTSCRHRRGLWPDLPVPDPLAPTPAQASRAAARDP